MPKEFFVMSEENYVEGSDPLIYKVDVELYINKLAPLADPENRLVFRIFLGSFDPEMERRKRIGGVRYYPLQKKLTKITNKIEKPFKCANQKEVIAAIDKTIQQILSDPDLKNEVAETIDQICPKCKKWEYNCRCNLVQLLTDENF